MLCLHKRNLESNFSYKEGSTLGWMWFAIGITFFQWCVVMTCIMVEGGVGQIIGLFLFTIEPIVLTALILRQKDLYSPRVAGGESLLKPKDNASELSPEKRNKLKHDLLTLLEKEEIFKDAELTIEKLCIILNTNRTYLWQVINQDMKTSFYRLINAMRLEKSVKMLSDQQHQNLPLNNLAEICGFKTINAFSAQFKREYGKTPSEWRKEALQGKNGAE
jgi:AraC-like DNA-binding protein